MSDALWLLWLRWLEAPARTAPGGELGAWVLELSGRALTRTGAPVDIPEAQREDVAGDVLVHLLSAGPAIRDRLRVSHPDLAARGAFATEPVDGGSEAVAVIARVFTRYVRVMLGHRWIAIQRQRAREESLPEPEAEGGGEEGGEQLPRALEAIGAALDEVIATRAVDPDETRRTFSEIVALALGERTMEEVIAEASARGEGGEPRTLRDRLYRRHRLLRRYLTEALDDCALDAEQISTARHALAAVLNRRPIRRASGISGAGDET